MPADLPDSLTTSSARKTNQEWRKRAHRYLSHAEALLLQILDIRTRGSAAHKVGIPTRLAEITSGRSQLETELSAEEAKGVLPAQWLDSWGELLFRLDKQIDKIESLVGSAQEKDQVQKERIRVESQQDPGGTFPQRQRGKQLQNDQRSISSDPLSRRSQHQPGSELSSRLFSFGEHTSPASQRFSNRNLHGQPSDDRTPLPDPTEEQLQAFQREHNIQSRVLADQDESLEQLSAVIKRQQHIGIQMNDELDTHNRLLDNLTEGADYTERHMHRANVRVNRLLEKMKGQGSWCLIAGLIGVLILILLLLRLIT